MINESSDAARDAMKAIRKRLTQNAGKNYTVIMYTLTVLETCVKNCGKAFHLLATQKEFIQELVKLIGPKNDPPAVVQEKVLSLIQIWADAFRTQPDLSGVVQVHSELLNKGIEFPTTDLEAMAPIYTPQRVSIRYPSAIPPNTSKVNHNKIFSECSRVECSTSCCSGANITTASFSCDTASGWRLCDSCGWRWTHLNYARTNS